MIQAVAKTPGQTLPQPIKRLLRAHARLRRIALLVGTTGCAIMVWMGMIAIECALDRWLRLGSGVRLAWLMAASAIAVSMFARPLSSMLMRPIDDLLAAESFEAATGVFNQELITLASQYRLPPDQRGAAGLLVSIEQSVTARLGDVRLPGTVSWRPAARWWIGVAIGLALAGALWPSAYVGARTLLMRATLPLAEVAPVTTTKLTVSAVTKVVRGSPVTISAVVGGEEQPVLHYSSAASGGGGWTETIMAATAKATGEFDATIPAVDRDLRYYVSAGDAASDTYTVAALAIPAVGKFVIDYTYPHYTRLADRQAAGASGIIAAPVGSRAKMTILCNTELTAAELIVGGTSMAMNVTGDKQASATVTVTGDARLVLNLHGANGVLGHGPGTMAMRAIVDQPPLVSMVEPTVDLELAPADRVTARYQASDDYGVVAVNLTATVLDSAGKKTSTTWTVSGDDLGPSASGGAEVDLAGLGVHIGDLVELQWTVRDGAGQTAVSDLARILISDQAVDPAARKRIAELRLADRLVTAAAGSLAKVRAAITEATTRGSNDAERENSRQLLASAAESLRLAQPPILRVISTCPDDPRLVVLCGDWLDEIETAWRGLSATGSAGVPDVERIDGPVRGSSNRVGMVQQQIEAALRGEMAEALVNARADLSAATTRPIGSDANDFVLKLQSEFRVGASEIGVDPDSAQVAGLLTNLRDAEAAIERLAAPVDFAAAASAASAQVNLPARLRMALAAEESNPHADYLWAWDLQLASGAAAIVENRSASDVRAAFAAVMEDVQKERDADRTGVGDVAAIHAAAGAARDKMELWIQGGRTGGDPGADSATQPTTRGDGLSGVPIAEMALAEKAASAGDWPAIAASVNAAVAMGRFGWAAGMDERMGRGLVAATRPAVSSSSGAATNAANTLPPNTAALKTAQVWSSVAEKIDGLERRESRIFSATQSGALTGELVNEQMAVGAEIDLVATEQSRQSNTMAGAEGMASRGAQIAALLARRRANQADEEALVEFNDVSLVSSLNTIDLAVAGWIAAKGDEWPMEMAAAMCGEAAGEMSQGDRDSALAGEGEVLLSLDSARRDAIGKSGTARLEAVGAIGARAGSVAADAGGAATAGVPAMGNANRQSGRSGGLAPVQSGAAPRDTDLPDYQEAIQAYFEALGQNQ